MSISQISLAPDVLQTIHSIDMCIVEGRMVCKQHNGFLFSGGREKRIFMQKWMGSHQSIISGILTGGVAER
jgi:hypothetical protein